MIKKNQKAPRTPWRRVRHSYALAVSVRAGVGRECLPTFPMISGSMAEMASRSDEVLTLRALKRNTPAAGNSIAACRNTAYGFSFATIKKFTTHTACVGTYRYAYRTVLKNNRRERDGGGLWCMNGGLVEAVGRLYIGIENGPPTVFCACT